MRIIPVVLLLLSVFIFCPSKAATASDKLEVASAGSVNELSLDPKKIDLEFRRYIDEFNSACAKKDLMFASNSSRESLTIALKCA